MALSAGFNVGFRVAQGRFFDSRVVMDATERAAVGVHTRFGARVRQLAKWSIRPHKGYSAPGNPPYSHVGLLRKFIFYWVERPGGRGKWGGGGLVNSVIIGPTLLKGKETKRAMARTIFTVPEILEYGGWAVRNVTWGWLRQMHELGKTDPRARAIFQRWLPFAPRKGQKTNEHIMYYAARPYMHPAFEKNLAVLPMLWKDAISEAGRFVGGVGMYRAA